LPPIKIDKEFQSLIPPLSQEEYKQLEANVVTDGCRDALVTWQGTLIDGHNRFKICTEHSIPFNCIEKEFDSRDDAIVWICKNQIGRRNIEKYVRGELVLRMESAIKAKAKEKQKESGGAVVQKSAKPPIKTRDELAKLAGVSHDTIDRVKFISEKATPDQLDRARKGGTGNTVNAIYQEIRQEETPTKVCKECHKELPLTDFYEGKGVCKSCFNHRKKVTDAKGETIKSNPEANRLAQMYSDEIERDLYDTKKEVEYTTDDLLDELHSLTDYFSRNTKNCLAIHSTLLSKPENKQKIIAALSEAEAAIQKTKELLL